MLPGHFTALIHCSKPVFDEYAKLVVETHPDDDKYVPDLQLKMKTMLTLLKNKSKANKESYWKTALRRVNKCLKKRDSEQNIITGSSEEGSTKMQKTAENNDKLDEMTQTLQKLTTV